MHVEGIDIAYHATRAGFVQLTSKQTNPGKCTEILSTHIMNARMERKRHVFLLALQLTGSRGGLRVLHPIPRLTYLYSKKTRKVFIMKTFLVFLEYRYVSLGMVPNTIRMFLKSTQNGFHNKFILSKDIDFSFSSDSFIDAFIFSSVRSCSLVFRLCPSFV